MPTTRRWIFHDRHDVAMPHRASAGSGAARYRPEGDRPIMAAHEVVLDGSRGEGGGQILRTALTLSLLTGRPFRLEKVRANRSRPGLRPQHLAAVRAMAQLGQATVEGDRVGSRTLRFRPAPYEPTDLIHDIGTAGSTALVLQTLHLAIASRAQNSVRVSLTGGTFNDHAPSFPFLEETWRSFQELLGLRVSLAMPRAGFYPIGGGQLEAWIEPGQPRPIDLLERGALSAIRGTAGVLNLARGRVAERLGDQALRRLEERGHARHCAMTPVAWDGLGQGAAIALCAEFAATTSHGPTTATFVGLGEPGKPAEAVADEAVDSLLSFLDSSGTVDPYCADQLLLPLSLAPGTSAFTTSEVTEHLRTNAEVIAAFLDRSIRIRAASDSGDPAMIRIS